VHCPLIHGHGSDRPVKVPRGGIPVEDPPLEATVPASDALMGKFREESSAQAAAPVLRLDVQILKIDTWAPEPGGEIAKVQGEADHPGFGVIGHETKDERVWAKEGAVKIGLRCEHLMGRSFILSEFVNQGEDRPGIAGLGPPDLGQDAFVSQKMVAISSILASS